MPTLHVDLRHDGGERTVLSVLYKSLGLQHSSCHLQSRQGGLPHLHSNCSICVCQKKKKKYTPSSGINTGIIAQAQIMSHVQQVRSYSKEETAGK